MALKRAGAAQRWPWYGCEHCPTRPFPGPDRYKTRPAQHLPTPTVTKLAQQHPTSTPTGTKLTRHTQNRQYLAILDMQGELSLASGASSASRANFLSHQTPLDAAHPYSQPQPVQNSPSNTPPAPQPVQNSPGTHKIGNIWPFWTCRANFLSLLELAQPAGRTFSRIRRHSTQHTHIPSPNRYKTHPATPHQHPNRYKTRPARRPTTVPPVTTTAKLTSTRH